MITLPQIALHTPGDKPGAPDVLANDSEGVAEDFLLLVRNAKAGLTLDAEKAPLLPEATMRKAMIKKDDSIKLAAELTNASYHAEPQDTLAALLAPTVKGSSAATKALLAAQDRGVADKDADLQAISALFAMLPQPQSVQTLAPAQAGKAPVASKAQSLAIATNAPLEAQSESKDSALKTSTENSSGRFVVADEKVNIRTAEAHIAASANAQTPLSPAISSSAPVIATGTPIATPATPILNAQLGSQEWQQQLSQQVMLFTRQGQQHAELRLHPEHLGKVEISLKLDDNQLQLQIMSPHSQVRAALEAAIPVLRTSLNESGLQLSQSQVGGEGSMQQHTDQREQQAARQNGTFSLDAQDDEETTLAVSETLQRLAQSTSAVDTFA